MPQIDDYTKLLLHMNGADASTTFIDSATNKTVTANGNAQIDTAQSKFGGASGLFDGTGDDLSILDSADWAFGTGDFTIEFWVRFNAIPPDNTWAGHYCQAVNANNWITASLNTDGAVPRWGFFVFIGGVVVIDYRVTTSVSTGVWYHVAFTKSGNSMRWFQDGVQVGATGTSAESIPDIAAVATIGSMGAAYAQYFNGCLDELRVSKGIARWTSNFTPPAYEYGYNIPTKLVMKAYGSTPMRLAVKT